jgi:hypothetical protein
VSRTLADLEWTSEHPVEAADGRCPASGLDILDRAPVGEAGEAQPGGRAAGRRWWSPPPHRP